MYVCLVLMLVALGEVSANSYGAPFSSCATMVPNHLGARPTSGGDLIYALSVDDLGNSVYNVTLKVADPEEQNRNFLGFFIQARNYTSGQLAEGEFTVPDASDIQARPCPGFIHPTNGITHNTELRLRSVSAIWSPPYGRSAAGVFFKATVVDTFEIYYIGLRANATSV